MQGAQCSFDATGSTDGWTPGSAWKLATARNPSAPSAQQPMAAPAMAPTAIAKALPASANAEKATPKARPRTAKAETAAAAKAEPAIAKAEPAIAKAETAAEAEIPQHLDHLPGRTIGAKPYHKNRYAHIGKTDDMKLCTFTLCKAKPPHRPGFGPQAWIVGVYTHRALRAYVI